MNSFLLASDSPSFTPDYDMMLDHFVDYLVSWVVVNFQGFFTQKASSTTLVLMQIRYAPTWVHLPEQAGVEEEYLSPLVHHHHHSALRKTLAVFCFQYLTESEINSYQIEKFKYLYMQCKIF